MAKGRFFTIILALIMLLYPITAVNDSIDSSDNDQSILSDWPSTFYQWDGNNSSGNNSGGNNSGGNNSGGNNSGGNSSSGGNSTTSDAHCLVVDNAAMNQTHYVTVDLVNTCSTTIMYPGINASADHTGVSGLYDIWWYVIGNNSTINMGWQLSLNQSIQNGTVVTLDFEAFVLNCGPNNSWANDCPNSNLSYQFTVISQGGNSSGGNNAGNGTGNNTGGNNSSGNQSNNPPVYRLNILSPINSSTVYGNSLSIQYITENYSGYVSWSVSGLNGTQSAGSSYSWDGSVRSKQIYFNIFDWIQICGSVQNNNISISDCVSVYRAERVVQGAINSVNTGTSGYTSLYAWGQNYSSGTITVNGTIVDTIGSHFTSQNHSNVSQNPIYEYFYIGYGASVICMNLVGENGSTVSDCVTVNRAMPAHSATILSPSNNTAFVGNQLSVSYQVYNTSSLYFTVNGQSTNYTNHTGQNSIVIFTGYGLNTVCLMSQDYAYQTHGDCITVQMLDPNSDVDQDGVPDHSDQCPNTALQVAVNSAGCSNAQIDSDQDGVMDDADLCPNTAFQSNVDANGCSMSQRDSDGDGILDSMDLCANTSANSLIDSNGCAESQLDDDSDGVSNDIDICPNTLALSQVDSNGCASNQRDSDSDGVVDSFDRCTNTPLGTVVDQTGCAYGTSSSGGNNSTSSGGGSSGGGNTPNIGLLSTLVLVTLVAITRRKNWE